MKVDVGCGDHGEVVVAMEEYVDILPLKPWASRDGVLLKNSTASEWFSAKVRQRFGWKVVGCACVTSFVKSCRLRGDFVLPGFRNLGIYSKLFDMRLQHVLRSQFNFATAFCTPSSAGIYIKNGFQKVREKQIRVQGKTVAIIFVRRSFDAEDQEIL